MPCSFSSLKSLPFLECSVFVNFVTRSCDYYKRVKSYYLVDVVTKEKHQFYSLQDVAKFLRRKDYRSISKYIDRGLLITRTSYKIYKYRTFKKRKRF